MSKKIFCDNCKKALNNYFTGEVFGYDYCGDDICFSRLVLKAHRNRRGAISTAMVPDEEMVKIAKQHLKEKL